MEGFIWTWDKEEPKYSKGCTIQKINSRWRNEENCNLKLPVACQSNTNHTHWIPSEKVGSWSEGDTLCEEGFKFSIPWNYVEDSLKYSAIDEVKEINKPLMIFIALDDEVVPPELTEKIVVNARNPYVVRQPNIGHDFRFFQSDCNVVMSEIEKFLNIVK